MSENNITDTTTSGDTTSDTGPTGGPRYRVHGSIRLAVTITAANPQEATQAVPSAVTDMFAAMPGAVIAAHGLALGAPQPLPSPAGQPHRYLVPVTVHGHVDLPGQDDGDLPYTALHAVAEHLHGRDDVTADLDSSVCDQITDITDATE